MKIIIPIQSISDVITNSSSELFCTIFSENYLRDIYRIINNIFGWNQESEHTPCIELCKKDEILKDWMKYSWNSKENIKTFPEEFIEIELPYGSSSEFYKYGIEGLLKDKFGEGNYKIIYSKL